MFELTSRAPGLSSVLGLAICSHPMFALDHTNEELCDEGLSHPLQNAYKRSAGQEGSEAHANSDHHTCDS